MSGLVFGINKQFQKFGDELTDECRKIESEIQKTDKEIDELVYKLYGITEKEKRVIKES